jgi:hypothetical protein
VRASKAAKRPAFPQALVFWSGHLIGRAATTMNHSDIRGLATA